MTFKSLNFEKVRVLVVGDVMLDQYWYGGTSRISPEAPVPVVQVHRMDERPGGAANVALGVAALGANPYLLGLIGTDLAGNKLENLLLEANIQHDLHKVADHSTITKLRILSRNQQMVRVDVEQHFVPDLSIFSILEANYAEALDRVDVVILSDYGKGTLSHATHLITKARAKNIPVVVDPKSFDYSVCYQGANIITPNLKEFEAVVGPCQNVDVLVEKGHRLLRQHQLEALVVTRSEHGLSVILANGQAKHIPATNHEVHDVTGAGDTVIAVLSVALACGMDLVEAATLGNIAAGVAVTKLGAVAVSVQELEHALDNTDALQTGMLSEDALLAAVQLSKSKGERIVFTNGCFDILHAGHVFYLAEAKRLGDRVIVAVNDDASAARLKGKNRPITPLADRMQVLAGLRSVDWVVSFSEDTPERLIKHIAPHVLVKGGDYKDVTALAGAPFVLSQGGEVKILGLQEGRSTTGVINAITAREEQQVTMI